MKGYHLKITLDNTPISRSIMLPEGYDFNDLHDIIQIVFQWNNEHLHEFIIGEKRIAPYFEERVECNPNLSYEKDVNLDQILNKVKEFKYIYDFGDNWEHTIIVENIDEKNKIPYPKLKEVLGKKPKENCGGVEELINRMKYLRIPNVFELDSILRETYKK